MPNILPAVIFIAMLLSPCVAATWTLQDPSTRSARKAKRKLMRMSLPLEPAPALVIEPPTLPSQAVLLHCARASQMRHLQVHGALQAGYGPLQTLRSAGDRF